MAKKKTKINKGKLKRAGIDLKKRRMKRIQAEAEAFFEVSFARHLPPWIVEFLRIPGNPEKKEALFKHLRIQTYFKKAKRPFYYRFGMYKLDKIVAVKEVLIM